MQRTQVGGPSLRTASELPAPPGSGVPRSLCVRRCPTWIAATSGKTTSDRGLRPHRFGDVSQVKARIEEASMVFAEEPEDPAWLYWLDRGELDAQAASAYVILERPQDAEPLSRDALGRLDAGQVQQAGLRQTSLARTLAFAGRVEEAALFGLDAYRSYQRCPADWTRRNLRELAPLLSDSRDRAVVDLRERLAAV